jgi:plastocyanin
MTRLHRALLVLAASAALVVTGCGGAGEEAEPVAATEVEMVKSYRFEPKAIEIEAGETVTWRNEDNFTHTVRVEGQEDQKVEPGRASRSPSTSPAPTTTSARFTAGTWTAR